jgi:hypothetical protein
MSPTRCLSEPRQAHLLLLLLAAAVLQWQQLQAKLPN